MKRLLISLLLLAGPLSSLAQSDEVEGLMSPEQERELGGKQMELERERGEEAADHYGEEVEDGLRDAPALDPDSRATDIDPVPPLISPGSPQIAPTPSAVPAPRLPGESERDTLAPDGGN
jgi:hypothetical protein